MHGAVPAPDRFGRLNSAFQFNGQDAWIEVQNKIGCALTNQISVCAWVKRSGPGQLNGRIVSGGTPANTVYYLAESDAADGILWRPILQDDLVTPSQVQSVCDLREWTFVVGTYDGETSALYLNGQLVATSHRRGRLATSTGTIAIGGETAAHKDRSTASWWNGLLDEIRIYDHALAAEEVSTLSRLTR